MELTIAPNGESPGLAGRVADVLRKSVDDPDEVVEFPNMHTEIVHLGDLTVGRMVNQPGWRWSNDVRPTVGGEWCQVRHVGFMISGGLGLDFPDGSSVVFGPGDVFDIPPGHDGYTVGDEPIVQIEWSGLRHWAGLGGARNRVLGTMLFVDVVSSTEAATRLGDAAWRDLLSEYFEAMRGGARALRRPRGEDHGGRDARHVRRVGPRGPMCGCGPAASPASTTCRCGSASTSARSRSSATTCAGSPSTRRHASWPPPAPDEIVVSELARMLAGAAGLAFEDRGTRELKGLDGEWRLAAVVEVAALPG